MPFTCQICDKDYKSYQSLYNHKRKYHAEIHKKNIEDKKNEPLECKYCMKVFTRKDNMKRHMKKCDFNYNQNGNNDENIDTNEKPHVELNNLYDLKSYLLEGLSDDNEDDLKIKNRITEKITKMESDNVQIHGNDNNLMNHSQNPNYSNNKITTNTNTNSNNVNSNSNNGNININLVTLGNENLSEILPKSEQIMLLKRKCQYLEELIQHVHLNDKYPQFQNVYVKDPNRNDIHVYDDETGDFIIKDRDEEISDLIVNRVNDVRDFFEENQDQLNNSTKQYVENYMNKIEHHCDLDEETEYIKKKRNNVKRLLYNGRHKVKNNFKKMKMKAMKKKYE